MSVSLLILKRRPCGAQDPRAATRPQSDHMSSSGPAHILGCRPPMVFWSGVGICHGGFPSHISGIVAANPRFCTGVVEMHNYIYKILHNIQWLYLGKAPHHTRCVPTVPGTRGAWAVQGTVHLRTRRPAEQRQPSASLGVARDNHRGGPVKP